jgi:hypothetical protein
MMQFDGKMSIFLEVEKELFSNVNCLLFAIVAIKRSSKLKLKQAMSLHHSSSMLIYGILKY